MLILKPKVPQQPSSVVGIPTPTDTPLYALRVWAVSKNRLLLLVNKKTGAKYRVVDFEPDTGRAKLIVLDLDIEITPTITAREDKLYYVIRG